MTAAAVQKTRFFAFGRIFFVTWLYNTYLFHISIFFSRLVGLLGKWQRKETHEAEQLYYYQYYFSISNLIFISFFRIDNVIPYIGISAPFYIRILLHSFKPHHVYKPIQTHNQKSFIQPFIHTFSFIHFSIFVQIERFHYKCVYTYYRGEKCKRDITIFVSITTKHSQSRHFIQRF